MKAPLLLIGIILISTINTAHASSPHVQIMAEKVSVSEDMFSITQDSIIDNVWFQEMSYDLMPGEGVNSNWLANSIWWSDPLGMITMDLGSSFSIQDILIQVDANDQYQLDYSIDNTNWSSLFTISPEDGEIPYGMDTMSSDPLHSEYVSSIAFSSVEAQYLRVSASGGDSAYFLSELQIFGEPLNNINDVDGYFSQAQTISPVPTPPSLMLFSAGLVILAGLQYRRKKLRSL